MQNSITTSLQSERMALTRGSDGKETTVNRSRGGAREYYGSPSHVENVAALVCITD
jgi:hypothetical protein